MGKDPDLIQIYSKNKRRYEGIKSSVDHRLRVLDAEKQQRQTDVAELPQHSHQHRKLRLIDEMIHDVNVAILMADTEGNKPDHKSLTNRLKKLVADRDSYVSELERLSDVEEEEKKKKEVDPKEEEEEDPDEKKKKKKDPKEGEEEFPEEFLKKKKKEKKDGNPYGNEGIGKDPDPKEEEEEDPDEKKKKKKDPKEGEEEFPEEFLKKKKKEKEE